MALTYDFDMHSVGPSGSQPRSDDMATEPGPAARTTGKVALFRDPNAVAALKGASEEVRACFLASGFRMKVHDSGAGPGRFPASDGPARGKVIERLMDNLEALPDDLNWNGFDIEQFAMAALKAKPVDVSAEPPRQPAPPRGAGGMDDFFAAAPTQTPASSGGGSMDDFFAARPADTRAAAAAPSAGPDMDAFFSNTGGRANTQVPDRPMTADDIRTSIDNAAPPKRIGLGPVKMAVMAVGLYVVISVFAGGGGAEKIMELATGVKMVAVGQ